MQNNNGTLQKQMFHNNNNKLNNNNQKQMCVGIKFRFEKILSTDDIKTNVLELFVAKR